MIAHARYSNLASPDRYVHTLVAMNSLIIFSSVYLAAKQSLEREMERISRLGIKTLVFQ